MPVCLLIKKKKKRCGFRWKGNVDKRRGGEDLEKVGGKGSSNQNILYNKQSI